MNTEQKHTPGPWIHGSPCDGETYSANIVFDGDGGAVASVYGLPINKTLEELDPIMDAEGIANARLIASAPELLEALEELAPMVGSMMGRLRYSAHGDAKILPKICAVIAKARGGA